MSGPFGSSQWMYSSGAEFYDFPIEQSLKFNDNDSSYLSWTPASAGNRRTWTWSGWVKRGNLGGTQTIFGTGSGAGGSVHTALTFNTSNQLDTGVGVIGVGTIFSQQTNAVFRDTSAWYHIVLVYDTSNATSTDRVRIYVNGERQSVSGSFPSQNYDCGVNTTQQHRIGSFEYAPSNLLDGYLAEVNFIDGQALDPTSFGETKSGVWIPKDPSNLTYGTNGFRLSFQNDTVSEGMNVVTYRGTGATQSINGLGLSPDLVWMKQRNGTGYHQIFDSVRGVTHNLASNSTDAEGTITSMLTSFDSDGFSLSTNGDVNGSGNSYVAWCWDAGSGSPVSNTDGSITSTVKANAAYGMSIVTWTGNGSSGPVDSVGHGLNSTPEIYFTKQRNAANDWFTFTNAIDGGWDFGYLNQSTAFASTNQYADSSEIYLSGNSTNASGGTYVAYAFHSVAGYSKVSSFTGTGAANNTITTGFKPAFVLLKNATNGALYWTICDNTRDTQNPNNKRLFPNVSNAEESSTSVDEIEFTDTGFILNSGSTANQSGATIIYYAVADTRDNAFWRDQSGNGNDWQPNNLTYQDSLPDSTTNNFAVLNPNLVGGLFGGGAAYGASEGNLKGSNTGSGGWASMGATFSMSTGKWYWEFASGSAAGESAIIGIHRATGTLPVGILGYTGDTDGYAYGEGGSKFNNSTGAAYGATWDQNDVIGIAYDADAGNLTFYKNNVSQGVAFSGLSGEFIPAISTTSGIGNGVLNFGQDSTFAGNKPAQGNTDDNGIGDFYYAPPSGYLALCTANLPDPVIDPAKDDVPNDYFNTITYDNTGGSYPEVVTGVGFQPDLIWIKSRTQAYSHYLFDAVRGTGITHLSSNSTGAEGWDGVTDLDSFDSDGFTIGAGAGIGDTNAVAWNWLAGNGTSSNTDGSISSTISVNQKAGFSIVSWTGNGSNTAQSIGHGLGAVPKFITIKSRNSAFNWTVLHGATTNGIYNLNTTGAINTGWTSFSSGSFDPSNVSSTTFSTYAGLSNSDFPNKSGDGYIAYCFAEVEGYSKFGSYVGNSSTDGPFVYTGFEVAFFLAKRIDGVENWFMIDNARHPYNDGNIPRLLPNTSDAEAEDASIAGDFLSNGFKIRATQNMINTSGANYIYMAFAENPFKYANAR